MLVNSAPREINLIHHISNLHILFPSSNLVDTSHTIIFIIWMKRLWHSSSMLLLIFPAQTPFRHSLATSLTQLLLDQIES